MESFLQDLNVAIRPSRSKCGYKTHKRSKPTVDGLKYQVESAGEKYKVLWKEER